MTAHGRNHSIPMNPIKRRPPRYMNTVSWYRVLPSVQEETRKSNPPVNQPCNHLPGQPAGTEEGRFGAGIIHARAVGSIDGRHPVVCGWGREASRGVSSPTRCMYTIQLGGSPESTVRAWTYTFHRTMGYLNTRIESSLYSFDIVS